VLKEQRGWRLVLARRASVRRAVPASVRRFARRARRRRFRSALPFLIALVVLALLGGAAVVVFGTSLLGVDDVRVIGATTVSADDVRTVAHVPAGEPLATLDAHAVERRVAGFPPIRSAAVRRDWPDTIVIRIVERTPIAVVPTVGGYALLDGAGVPYRQVDRRPPDLPLVRLPAPGPRDETTRSAIVVLAALTPALRGPLVALVADAPARIRLELTDGRTVVWGDATENAEKNRVAAQVLAGPDGASAKTLDVSAPSVVMVR
jgi:cell division protein FtsQ